MLLGKLSGKMVRKYYKQQYSLYRIIYMKLEPFITEGDKRWSSVTNMVNVHLQPPGVPFTFQEKYPKLTNFTSLFCYKKDDMFGFWESFTNQ